MMALMLALVGAGGGISVYWRKKEMERYRYELDHQVLETRLDYLAKYANDIIILTDGTGKIIDFNDRALEIYGYSSAEFSRMNLSSLRAEEFTIPFKERQDEIDRAGALRFESMHVTKNGTVFPVESSVRRIDTGGEKLYQSIMRDITERKLSEQKLHELGVHLQSVREKERTRIARELHDELGQSMTALRFDLKWLGENTSSWEKSAHEKLQVMNNLVATTVDSIRRISDDLRPAMLDSLGLVAAIENHVTKFSEQSGIACDLSMNQTDYDLDPEVATALFRITQEVLTNVARHSGASLVVIRLQEIEDKILLIVQDNGCGLPPATDEKKKSFGLVGMRERVKMLGGTLDIFNEKGAGVRIEACVPKHLKVDQ
jgi:PAS domain S-box-containing protein